MIKNLLLVLALVACFIGSGCGKKTSKPDEETPVKLTLILPAKNEICTTGQVISESISRVTFKWTAVANAASYLIRVTNLDDGNQVEREVKDSEAELILERGRPYSWFVRVTSAKDGSTTQSEEMWHFYNAGSGKISYVPFPPEILSPLWGRTVNVSDYGNIELTWKGTDVDGDIVGYDIYFGADPNPPLYRSNMVDPWIVISISRFKMYYWRVLCKDAAGNISDSGVYQFSTQ